MLICRLALALALFIHSLYTYKQNGRFKDNLRTIEAHFWEKLRTTEAHFDFTGGQIHF